MASLFEYKNDIDSLASQLQKLLKVIRHSDPSAEELKHLLHEKYQNHLTAVATRAKEQFFWDEFRRFLVKQINSNSPETLGENIPAIRKKLISDFENKFIIRQKLNEFTPPDPKEIQRRREIRKRRKAYLERKAKAETEQIYSRDNIMEMVQTTQKQRQARTKLKNLIEAIRKVDPLKIEIKISQSIKPKDR